ncbi:MAG TPA: DUF92 domain-containing protein [Mollicutes bacterium]|nr:DUF92 domain-containing protein [Mollicutes bacterium]
MVIFLSFIIPFYGLLIKKINFISFILIWLIGFIIFNYLSIIPYLALITVLGFAFISDMLNKSKKDLLRDYKDILSNVSVSFIAVLLYLYFKDNRFIVIYYATLAGILSDVLAGSFGTLSKGKPVNMFTFKKAEKGTSGAISLLGLYLSLVGGVIIALIFSLEHFNLKYFILISLSGLLGSIMDSSLGALVEVKYKCTVCNQETEEKYHCNQKGTIIKGYYFINNNAVNLLSNIIVFLVCLLVLI